MVVNLPGSCKINIEDGFIVKIKYTEQRGGGR